MSKGVKIAIAVVIVAVSAVTVYAISVFRGSADHLSLVPANSAVVIGVNLKELSSKISLSELSSLNLMKKAGREKEKKSEDKIMDDVLKDPKFSGVDPFSNVYYFIQSANDNEIAMGFVIHLLSASAFETVLEKNGVKNPVEDKGTYKRVSISDNMVAAWNSDAALFFIGVAENSKKECDKLMNQKKAESILSNKKFGELDKSVFDFSFFVNYDAALSNVSSFYNSYSFKDEVSRKALKEAFTTGTLNFKQDKIELDIKNHIKYKSAFEKVSYLKSSGVSDDHLKTISPDKVYAIFSANINMKKLMEAYKNHFYMAGMAAFLKEKHGLTDEDLYTMLTGEVSLTLVDFNEYETSKAEKAPDEEPLFKAMFPTLSASFSVKNKKNLLKVLEGFELKKGKEGYYSIPASEIPLFIVETEKSFTATNGKHVADLLQLKQEFKKPTEPVRSLVTKNPGSYYLDLDLSHYPGGLKEFIRETMGEKEYSKFSKVMQELKNLSFTMDNYRINGVLRFSDKNEGSNSLMRLIRVLDEVAKEKERS